MNMVLYTTTNVATRNVATRNVATRNVATRNVINNKAPLRVLYGSMISNANSGRSGCTACGH